MRAHHPGNAAARAAILGHSPRAPSPNPPAIHQEPLPLKPGDSSAGRSNTHQAGARHKRKRHRRKDTGSAPRRRHDENTGDRDPDIESPQVEATTIRPPTVAWYRRHKGSTAASTDDLPQTSESLSEMMVRGKVRVERTVAGLDGPAVRGFNFREFMQLLMTIVAPTVDAGSDWLVIYSWHLSGDHDWMRAGLTIQLTGGVICGIAFGWTLSERVNCHRVCVHPCSALLLAIILGPLGLVPVGMAVVLLVSRDKDLLIVLKVFTVLELMLETIPQSMMQVYVGVAYGQLDPHSQNFSYVLAGSVVWAFIVAGNTLFGVELLERSRTGHSSFEVKLLSKYGLATVLLRASQTAALIFSVALLACAAKARAIGAVVVSIVVYIGLGVEAMTRSHRTDISNTESCLQCCCECFTYLGGFAPQKSVLGLLVWGFIHACWVGTMACLFYSIDHVDNNYANSSLPETGYRDSPQHYDCHDRTSGLYPAALAFVLSVLFLVGVAALDPAFGLRRFRLKTWTQQLRADEKNLLANGYSNKDILNMKIDAIWRWADVYDDGELKKWEFDALATKVGWTRWTHLNSVPVILNETILKVNLVMNGVPVTRPGSDQHGTVLDTGEDSRSIIIRWISHDPTEKNGTRVTAHEKFVNVLGGWMATDEEFIWRQLMQFADGLYEEASERHDQQKRADGRPSEEENNWQDVLAGLSENERHSQATELWSIAKQVEEAHRHAWELDEMKIAELDEMKIAPSKDNQNVLEIKAAKDHLLGVASRHAGKPHDLSVRIHLVKTARSKISKWHEAKQLVKDTLQVLTKDVLRCMGSLFCDLQFQQETLLKQACSIEKNLGQLAKKFIELQDQEKQNTPQAIKDRYLNADAFASLSRIQSLLHYRGAMAKQKMFEKAAATRAGEALAWLQRPTQEFIASDLEARMDDLVPIFSQRVIQMGSELHDEDIMATGTKLKHKLKHLEAELKTLEAEKRQLENRQKSDKEAAELLIKERRKDIIWSIHEIMPQIYLADIQRWSRANLTDFGISQEQQSEDIKLAYLRLAAVREVIRLYRQSVYIRTNEIDMLTRDEWDFEMVASNSVRKNLLFLSTHIKLNEFTRRVIQTGSELHDENDENEFTRRVIQTGSELHDEDIVAAGTKLKQLQAELKAEKKKLQYQKMDEEAAELSGKAPTNQQKKDEGKIQAIIKCILDSQEKIMPRLYEAHMEWWSRAKLSDFGIVSSDTIMAELPHFQLAALREVNRLYLMSERTDSATIVELCNTREQWKAATLEECIDVELNHLVPQCESLIKTIGERLDADLLQSHHVKSLRTELVFGGRGVLKAMYPEDGGLRTTHVDVQWLRDQPDDDPEKSKSMRRHRKSHTSKSRSTSQPPAETIRVGVEGVSVDKEQNDGCVLT
eukprot:COSAG02_NODE_283_length_25709_cov_24.523311_16_plen_1395_part_00